MTHTHTTPKPNTASSLGALPPLPSLQSLKLQYLLLLLPSVSKPLALPHSGLHPLSPRTLQSRLAGLPTSGAAELAGAHLQVESIPISSTASWAHRPRASHLMSLHPLLTLSTPLLGSPVSSMVPKEFRVASRGWEEEG